VSALIASGLGVAQPVAGHSPEQAIKLAWNGANTLVPDIVGDTATLEIIGPLVARAPWYAKAYMGTVDPYEIADAIDALATNAAVKRLVIEIESCGGTTSGTAEAAAAMTRFQAAGKTVEVRASGMLASAAYWLAAGADRIVASPTAAVGYLGTVIVLCDDTGAAAAAGVRYEVIASTPAKAACCDPAITSLSRQSAQRRVDAITAVFRSAVAAGRGLDGAKLDAAFSGEGWIASEALAMGLIDAIASPADALDTPTGTAPGPIPTPPALDGEGPESRSSTPAAAAAHAQESIMDAKTLAALTALSDKHPTLAPSLIKEAAKPGATAEGLESFAAAADAKAQHTALVAERDAFKARAEAAEAKAKAADEAKAKAEADLARAQAHGTPHGDVGGDQNAKGPKPKFTKAQLAGGEIPKDVFASGHYEIAE